MGLQSSIPNLCRRSLAYFCWHKNNPSLLRSTSNPRKYITAFLPYALASSTLGRSGPFSRNCNIDLPIDISPSHYGSHHLGFAELPWLGAPPLLAASPTTSSPGCFFGHTTLSDPPLSPFTTEEGFIFLLNKCFRHFTSSSTVTNSTYIALPALTFHFLRSSPPVGVPDCILAESPRTAIPDRIHEHVPAYSNTECRPHEPGSDTTGRI
ncbi:putative mitochondrial protein [Senna tora]|uniref:Putative mitochondrial protein n=1 Tax=Senna tora TaxID=362788 RepID=A0A834WC55_9FABA|nr:putative mitochondrial protein [Senna tora]